MIHLVIASLLSLSFATARQESPQLIQPTPPSTTQPASAPVQTGPLVIIQEGDLPIILSAPHGGTMKIPGVDRRTGQGISKTRGANPNFSTAYDRNVDKIAFALADEIQKRTGKRPYVVVAQFTRTHIDANRPAEDAYESPLAAPVYAQYHDALRRFRTEILKKYRRGVLFDLHGHGRDPSWIIRGSADWQSTRHLVEEFGKESITGPHGLLAPLEAVPGNKIVPSNANNDEPEYKALNGGYITRHYGSFEGSNFDAIQFELGNNYRKLERIPTFASELADAVVPFMNRYLLLKDTPTTQP